MKFKFDTGAKFYFPFFGILIIIVFLVMSQGTYRVVTIENDITSYEIVPMLESGEYVNAFIAVVSLYALGGFFVIASDSEEEPTPKKRKRQ